MKKLLLLSIATLIILGAQIAAMAQLKTAPVYRFCSKKNYCIWIQSTNGQVPNMKGLSDGPWKNDGIVFHALTQSTHVVDARPMFYVLKSDNGGIRYFYSTNSDEIDAALKSGYVQNQTAFFVNGEPTKGAVPIYRLYSLPSTPPKKPSPLEKILGIGTVFGQANGPVDDGHFYTIDKAERDKQIAAGYKDEGIAGYAWEDALPKQANAGDDKKPDLKVSDVKIEDGKVKFLVSNMCCAQVQKFDVLVKIMDSDGNLIKQERRTFNGISSGQKMPYSVSSTISLENRSITVILDPDNKIDEDNKTNNKNGFALLKGSGGGAGDSGMITGPGGGPLKNFMIDITNINESRGKPVVSLGVQKVDLFPAFYFEDISSLPPNPCSGRNPNTRMIGYVETMTGGKWIEEGCKALPDQAALGKFVISLDKAGKYDLMRIVVLDRKTNNRYVSVSYQPAVFEANKVLTGCKRFAGRVNGEYLCSSTQAFQNCENFKASGRPVVCKVTSN